MSKDYDAGPLDACEYVSSPQWSWCATSGLNPDGVAIFSRQHNENGAGAFADGHSACLPEERMADIGFASPYHVGSDLLHWAFDWSR